MSDLPIRELGLGELDAYRELPLRVLRPDGADVLLWPLGGRVLRIELRGPEATPCRPAGTNDWRAARLGDRISVRSPEGRVFEIAL